MTDRARGFAALAALGLVSLVACGPAAPDGPDDVGARSEAVVVGAFNFTESKLLAEIYSETLRGARSTTS